MTPPDHAADSDFVEIRFPASTRFLAVARLAAAGLISDADPAVEVIENLQLAVNEILVLLVEASTPGASIEVEFRTSGNSIVVQACSTNPTEDGPPDVDPLTLRVLEATTDSYRFDPDGTAHIVVPVGRG